MNTYRKHFWVHVQLPKADTFPETYTFCPKVVLALTAKVTCTVQAVETGGAPAAVAAA